MKNQVAILGNFELVIECCNLIKASEFNIKCIFSETPSVVEWAEVHNIPVATKLDCFFQIIKSEEIDYLFSIQNPYIIPNEIIEHVGLAINYHNTLLPKYGGTRNNMCWVIWFNENQNGITWHVINDVIDGGGILKQIKFDIDKEETAFSLELKCQDFAKQGLRELLSDLKSDKLIVKLQDLKKRSFYYSYSRPCGFAVIDCNFPAEKIWKQFRALNFGSQPNPIATLKFKYKRKYFFIKEIHLLESKTDEFNPGTVIDINDNVILVTTLTSDMSINCYSDLSSIIKAKDVVEREQSLPKDQIKIAELIAKDEEYWKKVLLSFVPMKNFSQNRNINKYTNYQTITEFKFSEICNNSIKCKVNFETILTTLIGYLFKLNNFEQISLCLKGDKIVKVPDQTFTDLFLDIKPLNLVLDQYTTFNYALEKIKDLYSILVQKNVINKDVLVRYPKCMDTFSLNTLLVSISSNFDYKNYESNYPIIINVNESLQLVSLFIANKFIDSMPLFLNFIQEHFKILFESWVIDHKKLEEIHLLSQVEIQYWNDWNPIVENFSKKISVPDLLDKVCLSFPDNVAIESKNYKITYKELKSYSELMAKNLLRHLGNQSNSSNLIGVFLDKSPYTIITFLAILKSGTGYVVLDTSYPDTYLENIFLSSEPQLIIYENNVDRLNKISVNINKNVKPILLNLNDLLQINEAYIQLPTISDHNIAYVLFTSGSTGKPKGVAISHGSLINLCYATISHIGINKDDKMLQFAKLAFDASVFEIYSILIAGGILYVPDANEAVIGFDLKDTIVNNKISTLFLTPSSAVVQPYFKSSSLKRIIFGGEICSQMLVNKWGKGYEIFNGYGPTECTVFTTMTGSLKEYTSLIIGKPLRNYQVMVCDSHQKLLPLGAVGELVVSGIGIAKGYINGSKLTTERFKYIHFQGKNIYSYITGDLARWTIGGEIEYLGRNDLQVKVRGHRIETNLIEKTITAFNGINSCMVLADHDPNGVISLNAYILLQNVNSDFDIGLLKRFIDKKLPQFMLPSKFFLINHIPLTASGKIDTQTLLSQYNIPLLDKVINHPKTKLQQEIANIWQHVIGYSSNDIDINIDFYLLGGSSLQITQVLLKIQEKYNIQISTAHFLSEPTIKHLEEIILNGEGGSNRLINTRTLIRQSLDEFHRVFNISEYILTNQPQELAANIRAVFMTGVTGFLGSYVAKYFLEKNVKVFCLVRTKSVGKLANVLRKYQWKEEDISRLCIVEGDLSIDNFGLKDDLYNELASVTDAICNIGALVHHVYNYNQLSCTNINGVFNCIKFACSKKLKYLVHISTLSLLGSVSQEADQEDFINSSDLVVSEMNGYNASKLAAEIYITEILKDFGPFVKIYRPGWIGGDSTIGVIPYEKNHLFLLLKGILQLGYAPDWDVSVNMIPVDFIAKFIVNDILDNHDWKDVYNIVAPQSITFREFVNAFANSIGVKVIFINYEEWLNMIKNINADNGLYPLLTLYSGEISNSTLNTYKMISKIKHSKFFERYSKLNLLDIPRLEDLMVVYINYIKKSGF